MSGAVSACYKAGLKTRYVKYTLILNLNSRLKTYLFHKSSHYKLFSGPATDSADITTGPFLLRISVFVCSFLRYSVFFRFRAAD